jgi:hypothetical protein
VIRQIALIWCAVVLMGATLPRTGPVPAIKPEGPTQTTQEAEPAPAVNPDAGTPEAEASQVPAQAPGAADAAASQESREIPTPVPKPDQPPSDNPAGTTADSAAPKPDDKATEKETAETPPPPQPVKEDPEELKACMAELSALGAKFETKPPIDDGNGCGIESPIAVTEVLPGVELGGATMRCKTAVTMAHWLKDTVQPALNIAMPGRKITGLVPGSTYACRLRNSASTGKLSEHARGNAFDVAAFKLDNGNSIDMKPRDEDSTLEGAFQRTATAGACLHFSTVLSPGSDETHEDHLHLDILDRNNGYRYCR